MPSYAVGMEFVYLPVPSSRVGDVYRLLASDGPEDSSGIDPALLVRIYRESEESFRQLLDYLAERPDQPISTKRVAAGLRLSRGTASLAGMLGAFGRRAANRYDGVWPFEKGFNPVEDTNEFTMSRSVADVIKQAQKLR
jgi:hypothetical protein